MTGDNMLVPKRHGVGWNATLYTSKKRGNTGLWSITDRIKTTWKRSTRDIGGYWIGTCDYAGTRGDLLDMFMEGIGYEIREDSGGLITWQGYIAEMELTLDGIPYRRSTVNLTNAVKTIYTRIYDNMLTNGGGETGVWKAASGVGGTTGTASMTQSACWVNTGNYSMKIVSPGGIQGAWVGASGYAYTVAASTQYDITGVVAACGGSWRISCNRSDTDGTLAFDSTRAQMGEKKISISIPTSSSYAGTVDLRITSEGSSGSIYADSFYFQQAGTPAQTGWKTDAASISEYGRYEQALLEAGMTSEAANAKAATVLKKQAWARTTPPNEFTVQGGTPGGTRENKLTLTLHGYAHTLANRYSLTTGTAEASAHVRSILLETEFVIAGGITSNTMQYVIDNRAPIKHWQILMDIIKAGDGSGNRWTGGVLAGNRFYYEPADGVTAYRYRGGKFYHPAGGELEPWFAEPGHLLYLDDAPVGPTQISGNAADDPHVVYVSEIEMGPASDQFPLGVLTMKHEELT